MHETVYSSAPALEDPRRFLARARDDLRLVPRNAWRLFVRSTRARYRGTLLGYAWLVVPMTATTLIWAGLSHAGLVRFHDTGAPYVAYVVIGFALWQLFADALQAPLRRLESSRAALGRTRLPHETWLAAAMLEVLLAFVLRLAVVLMVVLVTGVGLRPSMLLVPLGAAALLILGFALGLLLTPPGLLFGDVGEAIAVVVGLWFFLTPIVYPLGSALSSGTTVGSVVRLNPVTPLLITTRHLITGGGPTAVGQALGVTAFACVLLVLAWLLYRLARPHLAARF